MKKIKNPIIFSGIIIILLGILTANIFFWSLVRIDGRTFIAKLPLSEKAYQKGLGGEKKLCSFCAMLFRFSKKGEYAFWMKNMNFDLDILWIRNGKIVYIKKNFSADSLDIVQPGVPSDTVLEINAGLAEKYGFMIGDEVNIY